LQQFVLGLLGQTLRPQEDFFRDAHGQKLTLGRRSFKPAIRRQPLQSALATEAAFLGQLTRSRPLARPSRAFGSAEFLSPLPKRLKFRLPIT
jgi:hypothetical protein